MKKQHYSFSILALTLIFALPLVIHAQENQNNPPPPPFGGLPQAIRDQVQTSYESSLQGARDNQNYRNNLLEGQGNASGTPPFMGGPDASSTHGTSTDGHPPFPPRMGGFHGEGSSTPDGRFGSSTRPWNGTSTPPWFSSTTGGYGRGRDGNSSTTNSDNYERGVSLRVHMETFRRQQDQLIKELTVALDNLENIRSRIASRISTEEGVGVDMTNASSSLDTADADISAASDAIQALANLSPSATSTATTTIDLTAPRKLGADAIKAVDDARNALGDVIQVIIKDIGLDMGGFGDHGDHGYSTTTPPTATSTGSGTSTTTASTTTQ